MEYIKRKFESNVETNNNDMFYSQINGVRLSVRWKVNPDEEKKKPSDKTQEDIVVNFTKSETEQITNLLKGGRNERKQ